MPGLESTYGNDIMNPTGNMVHEPYSTLAVPNVLYSQNGAMQGFGDALDARGDDDMETKYLGLSAAKRAQILELPYNESTVTIQSEIERPTLNKAMSKLKASKLKATKTKGGSEMDQSHSHKVNSDSDIKMVSNLRPSSHSTETRITADSLADEQALKNSQELVDTKSLTTSYIPGNLDDSTSEHMSYLEKLARCIDMIRDQVRSENNTDLHERQLDFINKKNESVILNDTTLHDSEPSYVNVDLPTEDTNISDASGLVPGQLVEKISMAINDVPFDLIQIIYTLLKNDVDMSADLIVTLIGTINKETVHQVYIETGSQKPNNLLGSHLLDKVLAYINQRHHFYCNYMFDRVYMQSAHNQTKSQKTTPKPGTYKSSKPEDNGINTEVHTPDKISLSKNVVYESNNIYYTPSEPNYGSHNEYALKIPTDISYPTLRWYIQTEIGTFFVTAPMVVKEFAIKGVLDKNGKNHIFTFGPDVMVDILDHLSWSLPNEMKSMFLLFPELSQFYRRHIDATKTYLNSLKGFIDEYEINKLPAVMVTRGVGPLVVRREECEHVSYLNNMRHTLGENYNGLYNDFFSRFIVYDAHSSGVCKLCGELIREFQAYADVMGKTETGDLVASVKVDIFKLPPYDKLVGAQLFLSQVQKSFADVFHLPFKIALGDILRYFKMVTDNYMNKRETMGLRYQRDRTENDFFAVAMSNKTFNMSFTTQEMYYEEKVKNVSVLAIILSLYSMPFITIRSLFRKAPIDKLTADRFTIITVGKVLKKMGMVGIPWLKSNKWIRLIEVYNELAIDVPEIKLLMNRYKNYFVGENLKVMTEKEEEYRYTEFNTWFLQGNVVKFIIPPRIGIRENAMPSYNHKEVNVLEKKAIKFQLFDEEEVELINDNDDIQNRDLQLLQKAVNDDKNKKKDSNDIKQTRIYQIPLETPPANLKWLNRFCYRSYNMPLYWGAGIVAPRVAGNSSIGSDTQNQTLNISDIINYDVYLNYAPNDSILTSAGGVATDSNYTEEPLVPQRDFSDASKLSAYDKQLLLHQVLYNDLIKEAGALEKEDQELDALQLERADHLNQILSQPAQKQPALKQSTLKQNALKGNNVSKLVKQANQKSGGPVQDGSSESDSTDSETSTSDSTTSATSTSDSDVSFIESDGTLDQGRLSPLSSMKSVVPTMNTSIESQIRSLRRVVKSRRQNLEDLKVTYNQHKKELERVTNDIRHFTAKPPPQMNKEQREKIYRNMTAKMKRDNLNVQRYQDMINSNTTSLHNLENKLQELIASAPVLEKDTQRNKQRKTTSADECKLSKKRINDVKVDDIVLLECECTNSPFNPNNKGNKCKSTAGDNVKAFNIDQLHPEVIVQRSVLKHLLSNNRPESCLHESNILEISMQMTSGDNTHKHSGICSECYGSQARGSEVMVLEFGGLGVETCHAEMSNTVVCHNGECKSETHKKDDGCKEEDTTFNDKVDILDDPQYSERLHSIKGTEGSNNQLLSEAGKRVQFGRSARVKTMDTNKEYTAPIKTYSREESRRSNLDDNMVVDNQMDWQSNTYGTPDIISGKKAGDKVVLDSNAKDSLNKFIVNQTYGGNRGIFELTMKNMFHNVPGIEQKELFEDLLDLTGEDCINSDHQRVTTRGYGNKGAMLETLLHVPILFAGDKPLVPVESGVVETVTSTAYDVDSIDFEIDNFNQSKVMANKIVQDDLILKYDFSVLNLFLKMVNAPVTYAGHQRDPRLLYTLLKLTNRLDHPGMKEINKLLTATPIRLPETINKIKPKIKVAKPKQK